MVWAGWGKELQQKNWKWGGGGESLQVKRLRRHAIQTPGADFVGAATEQADWKYQQKEEI